MEYLTLQRMDNTSIVARNRRDMCLCFISTFRYLSVEEI